MPRLPNLINRDELPESLHETYDQVAGSRQGSVSGPYGVLLHSPELAVRGAAMSNYLRWNSALTPVQRETAILTAARDGHCDLIVTGAVRHSPIHELVFGSVTGRVLDGDCPLPVLLSA